jgi:hypothetical protein
MQSYPLTSGSVSEKKSFAAIASRSRAGEKKSVHIPARLFRETAAEREELELKKRIRQVEARWRCRKSWWTFTW